MTLELPVSLWKIEDYERVKDLAALFSDQPLILTDNLANAVYLNERAEDLFQERAEALVNRLSFSLLGFNDARPVSEGLKKTLLGKAPPWRGIVHFPEPVKSIRIVDASAIVRPSRLIAGVIRISNKSAGFQ